MNIQNLFSKIAGRAQDEVKRLESLVSEQAARISAQALQLEQSARELAEKDEVIALKDRELHEKQQEISAQKTEIENLNAQLDWLKRQVFGDKSTRTSTLDTINGQECMIFVGHGSGNAAHSANGKPNLPVPDLSSDSTAKDGVDPGCRTPEQGAPCESISMGTESGPSAQAGIGGVLLAEEEVQEGKAVRVDSFTRKTGRKVTRKATFEEIVSGLKQNRIEIPAEGDQLTCPACGETMEHLGWNRIRTEIVVHPATYEANVYYGETLKCGHCSNDEKTEIVKTNNVPPAVIPRSLASSSLIASTAIMKYSLFVPNYRLEKYILPYGVKLTRESMANWLIYVCMNYLAVMYEWLHQELLTRPVINADETPGQVNHFKELVPWTDHNGDIVDEKTRKSGQAVLTKKARSESEDGELHKKNIYMWLYASRYGTEHPLAIYDYQPSRAGACCESFLGKDYSGYLMVDGYSGYNTLEKATRCCCMAHFRSYWYEAIKTKQGGLDKNDPAVAGFQFSNQLFRIEREVAQKEPEERQQVRMDREKPLWEWFWKWQEGIEASGGSPLYKALTYARNHRDTLENYMLDGNLPMTNVYALSDEITYPHLFPERCVADAFRGKRCG